MSDVVPQETVPEQPAAEAPAAPSSTPATVWVRYAGVPRGFPYWEVTGPETGLNWTPGRTEELSADRAARLLDLPGFELAKPVAVVRQP